jgi:hypothetical protein
MSGAVRALPAARIPPAPRCSVNPNGDPVNLPTNDNSVPQQCGAIRDPDLIHTALSIPYFLREFFPLRRVVCLP